MVTPKCLDVTAYIHSLSWHCLCQRSSYLSSWVVTSETPRRVILTVVCPCGCWDYFLEWATASFLHIIPSHAQLSLHMKQQLELLINSFLPFQYGLLCQRVNASFLGKLFTPNEGVASVLSYSVRNENLKEFLCEFLSWFVNRTGSSAEPGITAAMVFT